MSLKGKFLARTAGVWPHLGSSPAVFPGSHSRLQPSHCPLLQLLQYPGTAGPLLCSCLCPQCSSLRYMYNSLPDFFPLFSNVTFSERSSLTTLFKPHLQHPSWVFLSPYEPSSDVVIIYYCLVFTICPIVPLRQHLQASQYFD